MEIRRLKAEEWKGKKLHFSYKTKGYYEVIKNDLSIQFDYRSFTEEKELGFDDEVLVGIIELSMESWNQRLRISNILIFEDYRHKGIGMALIKKAKVEAVSFGARMIVLKTQSCNERAISFYRKKGFELIGMDLYSYSNQDIENHHVRLEMGLIVKEKL